MKLILFLFLFISLAYSSKDYSLPVEMEFAGQKIPLEYLDVRFRILQIHNQLLYDRKGFLNNIYEKYEYFIPKAKEIFRKNNIHEDFVYIALAESQLTERISSQSRAEGPWQFIEATAKKFNLTVSNKIDERRLFIKSTEAAANFIDYLLKSPVTKGDVFLVLACYNNGEAAVNDMLKNQNTNSFWECISNSETSDYVPRVLVYKEIFNNPIKYNLINDSLIDLNYLIETEYFNLILGSKRLFYSQIANYLGISYREFYHINSHIDHASYRKGGYFEKYSSTEIQIPINKAKKLKDSLKLYEYLGDGKIKEEIVDKGNYIIHTVTEATLGEIAFKYQKNWKDIVKDNNLKVRKLDSGVSIPIIRKGMKLKIYK